MKTLTILRGLPGSGKSEFAKQLPRALVCSTDDFFTNSEGEYKIDFTKFGEAHAYCRDKMLDGILLGHQEIVIDNTNIQLWEMRSYLMAGAIAGYRMSIVEWIPTTLSEVKYCHARNTHGVPLATIATMALNWSPSEITVRELHSYGHSVDVSQRYIIDPICGD